VFLSLLTFETVELVEVIDQASETSFSGRWAGFLGQ